MLGIGHLARDFRASPGTSSALTCSMELGTGCSVLRGFLSEPALPLAQGIGSHLFETVTVYAEDVSLSAKPEFRCLDAG